MIKQQNEHIKKNIVDCTICKYLLKGDYVMENTSSIKQDVPSKTEDLIEILRRIVDLQNSKRTVNANTDIQFTKNSIMNIQNINPMRV